jgi:hypothetical protein
MRGSAPNPAGGIPPGPLYIGGAEEFEGAKPPQEYISISPTDIKYNQFDME